MRAAVLGSGGWGTALSLTLCDNGHDVTLWSHSPEKAAQMAAQARQELAAAEQEKGGAPAEAGVADADPAAQQSQAVAAQKNQGIAAYQRQAVDAGAVGAQPSASPGMPIDLYA